MKQFTSSLFILIFTINAFSQENYIKHRIEKGESIYKISKKYNVKPDVIFQLNPVSKKVLKVNSILLIPNSNTQNTAIIVHEVLPKQTLYSISKQYAISIEDIKNANPIIDKEGLEIGLKLTIPKKEAKPEIAILTEPKNPLPEKIQNLEITTHEVLPKETKYGISKQYGITIQELEILNPEILKELPVGYKLVITKLNNSNQNISVVNVITPNTEIVSPKINDSIAKPIFIIRNEELLNKLVSTASENIGIRYRSGGTSKEGFDCSGLMIDTFGSQNIQLPRTSAGQSNFGTQVNIFEAEKGDLIFFTTNGSGNINHVGMITEVLDGEVKFIHASVHGGVIISSNKENYYSKRFVKINRVLE